MLLLTPDPAVAHTYFLSPQPQQLLLFVPSGFGYSVVPIRAASWGGGVFQR